MTIRPIQPTDDVTLFAIIRTVLKEYGADIPGTAWSDPHLTALSGWYGQPRSGYWVVEHLGVVIGGCGVGPLIGGEKNTCELQKMYLMPEARGKGFGVALIEHVFKEAQGMGYDYCYLETLPAMTSATRLYEKNGFQRLNAPMGNTGHHECGLCYGRTITL